MKKIICCLFAVFFFSSCTFLNMLPNKARDKWYMEHAGDYSIDYDLLRKIFEGNTKEDALREWGEPWKRKSEDVWVYKFSFMKNKIVLKFENDVVVKRYGTMW